MLASPPDCRTILRHARPFISRSLLADPARILATISMDCPDGAEPYAVLGLLIEGTVRTLVEHMPKQRQAEIAKTLKQLLDERMKACGVPDRDR